MKKNYNFNKNLKNLSDADIDKHMDFDAVLNAAEASAEADPGIQPKKRGKLRWLRAVAGIAAAVLAGAVLFFGLFGNKNNSENHNNSFANEDSSIETPYVNPPFKHIKPTFASQKIRSSKGGVYKFPSGSKVIVPKNAFVDKDGKPVHGKVDIKFREFHDYVDFFMSGIPMEYDSNGTNYMLESAGMIEIYAEKNGERVEVAPGKTIEVELISNIAIPNVNVKPDFNIYRLDVEKRNWEYNGVDKIEYVMDPNGGSQGASSSSGTSTPDNMRATELLALNNNRKVELKKIEATIPKPAAPAKPMKENGSDLVFDLDFESAKVTDRFDKLEEEKLVSDAYNELVEMKEKYGEVLWQISPRNGAFDEKKMEVRYDDVQITKLTGNDFEITLSNPIQNVTLLANPVLSGANYEKALAEFSSEFAKYEQELASRESQLADMKNVLNQRIAADKAAVEKTFEERLAVYRKHNREDLVSNEIIKQQIINRFEVSSFGIWNCDRPLPHYMTRVKGDFTDKSHKFYNNKQAFMVDKSRNTVSKFITKKDQQVIYNKDADNIMWFVTKENKLAVYRPENFRTIEKETKGKVKFVMDIVNEEIDNEEDVRRILRF